MLRIVKHPHPALRLVAKEVEIGEDLRGLITEMFAAMRLYNGVGLAANQVDILKRVIVVHVGGFKQAFINPVIVDRQPKIALSKEGCLSFPGKLVGMHRNRKIIVTGYDQDWAAIRLTLTGKIAYCVQHEVDHLNGVTIFTDRESIK